MANADTPSGLNLVGHRSGSSFNARVRPYYIPATYGTAVFVGDAVTKTGTANTTPVTAVGIGTLDVATLPEVNKTAVGDGNAITGVVVGFAPSTRDSLVYGAASTERVALVCDDPDAEFEIQADGAIAATQIGLNAVLIATHAGSTATGQSGLELDTTSDAPAADASNQLTICVKALVLAMNLTASITRLLYGSTLILKLLAQSESKENIRCQMV
jgi:hypothetical protein